MSLIRGKNVIVLIFDDGQWKLYGCGTNCTLETVTDFAETSVKGNGKFRNFVPTVNSFTGSIEGLTNLDQPNTLTLPDLRQKQLAHVKLLMRFDRTDETGANTYVDEAFFFISNVADSGPHEGMNSYTVSLRGTGELTQIFIPTTVNPAGKVKSIYINVTGSETGFTSYTPAAGLLINKDITGVWRGTDVVPVTTGTPSATEIKYTIATGKFDWLIPLDPTEIIHVQYQDI